MGDKIHKLCGVEILLNASTEHYRWTEVVAVKTNTVPRPGRFPAGLEVCLKIWQLSRGLQVMLHEYTQLLDRLLSMLLQVPREASVLLESLFDFEGDGGNHDRAQLGGVQLQPVLLSLCAFHSMGGFSRAIRLRISACLGHEEAVEFMNIVIKFMPTKES
jgi:hypothetical protein